MAPIAAMAFLYLMYILLAGLWSGPAVHRIALKHQKALALTWTQTTHVDQYGALEVSAWQRQCRYFLENVVSPELGYLGRKWLFGRGWDSAHRIVGEVAIAAAEVAQEALTVPTQDPAAFEIFIASELRRFGWSAVITGRSGDQGTDVVAEKLGTRIAIQAKLYASPVGNAAVQEAHAGKAFRQAHSAAVVSNAAFTPSAYQLASVTGVLLLHHSQLGDLDQLCGIVGAERIA